MATSEKTAAVAEIVEAFNDASGAVLTEYRGLSVKQLKDLRRALGENASLSLCCFFVCLRLRLVFNPCASPSPSHVL